MNAIRSEKLPVFLVTTRLDDGLHIPIQVGKEAFLLFRELLEKAVVGRKLLVVGIILVLSDHGGGKKNDLNPSLLTPVNDLGDIGFVVGEVDATFAVPDVIDATAKGHPVGLFA